MKNKTKDQLRIEELEQFKDLYRQYKSIKDISNAAFRKASPLTLDEHLENINPYYVRSMVIHNYE